MKNSAKATSDKNNSEFDPASLPQDFKWKKLIGREKTRQHTVHPREIRRFLNAIGESTDDNDLLSGSPQLQKISVLFYQTLIFDDADLRNLPADGSPVELDIPNTGSRSVGGGSDFLINRAVIPGETLTVRSKVQDIYSKMGASGLLYFIMIETKIEDQSQNLVARELATYIRRDQIKL